MTTRIVFGTRNPGKVREVARLLAPYDVEVTSLLDHPDLPDAIEDADTFLGNALIKAQHICDHLDCLALADDSGLVVDALDGRPGVYSARYGGPGLSQPAKNQKLLGELADTPDPQRTARFVCVLVAAQPNAQPRHAEGTCEGHILHTPRGDGGFGYDPIFGPTETPGLSMAQLPPDRKNHISHRGRATQSLLPHILDLLGISPQ